MKPCYEYAYHYISRYPKTVHELTIQLRKKGYGQEEIDLAIQKLSQDKYVDDRQFCELYLASEVEKKGKPLYRVRGKLIHKGVDKYLIAEVVEEMEQELIDGQKFTIRKEINLMKGRGIDGVVIIQKLQGRGYNFGLIKEVIEDGEGEVEEE